MGCRACAERHQQQSSKNRPASVATRGQNNKGAQSQGANLRDKMRFTGR